MLLVLSQVQFRLAKPSAGLYCRDARLFSTAGVAITSTTFCSLFSDKRGRPEINPEASLGS